MALVMKPTGWCGNSPDILGEVGVGCPNRRAPRARASTPAPWTGDVLMPSGAR